MQIHPRIDQINIWWDEAQDEVEVYLIKGNRKAIIDSGPPNVDRTVLYPSLAAQDLMLNDIEVLLNTHWHIDHAGGNAAIKAISDAKIMMHKDDARLYEDQLYAFNRYRKPVITALGDMKMLEREQIDLHGAAGHNLCKTTQPLGRGPAPGCVLVGLVADLLPLGFDRTYGSVFEIVDGVYTGEVVANLILGEEKARFAQGIARDLGIDLSCSLAFGDTDQDVSMLSLVGIPVAVNPNTSLREICETKGWELFTTKDLEDLSMLTAWVDKMMKPNR